MGIDELREFREDFHNLVGALAAGCHHNYIGITLLCDGVLKDGLTAAEGARDKARTAFCDGVEGVYYAYARFHDLVGARLFLVALDGNLYGPFLGHGDVHLLTFLIAEDGNHGVYVVLACFLDGFYGEGALEAEGDHDLVGQPAFLYLAKPVGRNHGVSGLCDRGELPKFLTVKGIRVFSSFQEYTGHGSEVVLKTVVGAGEKAGAKGDLQHPALEFNLIAAFHSAGALEHLHGCQVSVNLDNLCHQFHSFGGDVADFVLGNRAVYLYGNKVGDDSLYNTFSFHMFICLYNLLL